MLGGATPPPAMSPDQKVIPAEAQGVKIISMAMLSDDDSPVILRGPMVTKYLQMFVRQVDWGQLDILLLDLPPGTGDIQLTLAQAFPLSGAVVVSTPQDVSLKIARRGLRMLEQVSVPILGVIENMSGFTCPSCGTVTHIFHQGGGEAIAQELGVPFLGKVPLDPSVVDCGDEGRPLVRAHPDSPAAAAYRQIAATLAGAGGPAQGIATPFAWTLAEDSGKPAPVNPSPGGTADRLAALDHDATGLALRLAGPPALGVPLGHGCAQEGAADRDVYERCAPPGRRDLPDGQVAAPCPGPPVVNALSCQEKAGPDRGGGTCCGCGACGCGACG